MKKLYLIRHGKSDWSNILLDDFNRPLNKRGEKNASFMGHLLSKKNVCPDIFFSSPAKRAKDTALKIKHELKYKKEIIFAEDIYEASFYNLFNLIKETDNKSNTIFLLGHNPSLNIFTSKILDFGENIPTCGIIEMNFSCNMWEDIHKSNSELISFEYPKKYK